MAHLPKMTIAFVIRRCTLALGHRPSTTEFTEWANREDTDDPRPFGRSISEREAALILRNQDRLVTARSAQPHERHVEQHELPNNVISLSAARAEMAGRRQKR